MPSTAIKALRAILGMGWVDTEYKDGGINVVTGVRVYDKPVTPYSVHCMPKRFTRTGVFDLNKIMYGVTDYEDEKPVVIASKDEMGLVRCRLL